MGHLSAVVNSTEPTNDRIGPERRSAHRLVAVAVALIAVSPAVAHAQSDADAPNIDWAYQMAHELMSPFCPGRTLAECPSPNAAELRMWIRNQAAAGATRAEVEEMLYERFGEVIRSHPKVEGWGVTAYAFPVLFFVLGGPLAYLLIRRLVDAKPTAPSPATSSSSGAGAVDPELEAELDRQLGDS